MICENVTLKGLDELQRAVAAARRGEQSARIRVYCAVYHRHRLWAEQAARPFSASWLGSALADAIHDCAEDAAVQCLVAVDAGSPVYAFSRLARRTTERAIRRRLGDQLSLQWLTPEAADQIPERSADSNGLSDLLAEANQCLKRDEIDVIMRYVVARHAFERISLELGVSVAAVRSRYYRAIVKLLTHFGDRRP